MVGLGQIKNEQLFAFSHHENGIAGYKHFHDPLLVDGVYRCLGVFRAVLNTVGWMEGVILIPKRIMSWKGVKVFRWFWGERIKFIVRILDVIISGRGLGAERIQNSYPWSCKVVRWIRHRPLGAEIRCWTSFIMIIQTPFRFREWLFSLGWTPAQLSLWSCFDMISPIPMDRRVKNAGRIMVNRIGNKGNRDAGCRRGCLVIQPKIDRIVVFRYAPDSAARFLCRYI